ncbi:MAG: hypothetical protein WBM86_32250, partial [Waterburya sp.]
TTNIICNPFYTVYTTTAHKDRLSVLKALQNGRELEFLLQPVTKYCSVNLNSYLARRVAINN